LLDGTLLASPTPPLTEPRLEREGLSWTADRALTDRIQIDAQAWLRVRHGPPQPVPLLRDWLQLPYGYNPRTLAWARALQQQPELARADPRGLSDAVLRHIREHDYRYTMVPGEDATDARTASELHLIDRFWLDRREGFCEHFATAYVVVMRAMGVPSRVITGYQGAEINPVDGLFVVRNSDAHAWAEFWQPGEGWVRVDPTGAVAPERIERPRQSFGGRNTLPGPLANIDPAVWGRLRDYIDASNHRWNLWVLQYSRHRQMQLLKDWGVNSPDLMDLVRLCGIVVVSTSMLGIGWLWWTRPRTPRTPWRRPLMKVHRALESAGLPPPGSSPAPAPALSWASHLARLPAQGELAAVRQGLVETLQQLDTLRYAHQASSPRSIRQARGALVQTIVQQAQQWRSIKRRDRAN
jgi:transglutaminase-like putative cysteine protease